MLSYGFSIRGKSHVDTGVVCQDANIHGEIVPKLYIAVAADGVGSAAHSDIASSLATQKLVEYLKQHVHNNDSDETKIACLRVGYQYAENAIESYVRNCGGKINEYDTTLHAVLYDGRKVIYGHAGDGGILVRTWEGKTQAITSPQKGSDGVSVMPLRAGAKSWEFGCCEDKVAAVMLVTDGILDRVIMPYLLNLPDNMDEDQLMNRHKANVYLSATEFFMNPFCVLGNKKLQDPLGVYRYILTGEFQDAEKDWQLYLNCLRNGYQKLYGNTMADEICNTLRASVPLWNIEDTTDDKTVVCLINERVKISAPSPNYFFEPDWAKLRQHYEHLLYPSGLNENEKPHSSVSDSGREKKTSGRSWKSIFKSIMS